MRSLKTLRPVATGASRVGVTRRNATRKRTVRQKANEGQVVNGVWNLSKKTLSREELEVLALGLTFSPTPLSWPPVGVQADCDEFTRKLRLLKKFADDTAKRKAKMRHLPCQTSGNVLPQTRDRTTVQPVGPRVFPVKSGFEPGPMMWWPDGEKWLKQFTAALQAKIQAGVPKTSNLTKWQKKNLRTLKARRGLVIKKADKGSAIVVMNQSDYCEEAMRQLLKPEYYQEIKTSLREENAQEVRDILTYMEAWNVVDMKTLKYLSPPGEPKHRHAYFLPKIHKEKSKWWRTKALGTLIPPGRPIISNVGSETSATAEFLDFWLQPSSRTLPALVKDSYDFIAQLDQSRVRSLNVTLVTADIKDLYTNISQEGAMKCMSDWIDEESDIYSSHLRVALKRLMRLQLCRNDIEFDGRFFRQVLGVSMGWSPAPTVANFFLRALDRLILDRNPLVYYRFIDDVFLVWDNGRPGLDELMAAANAWNPQIQLLWQTDKERATFLDVEVYTDPRQDTLKHRVWFKETDTHALLHSTSCHAAHTFRGIVKSQLIRFHRLCTDRADCDKAIETLFEVLVCRGYSPDYLSAIRIGVAVGMETGVLGALPVALVANWLVGGQETCLPICVPFSPELSGLAPWIHQQWGDLLSRLPPDQTWLPKSLTVAWRKNDTLKDLLVRSTFSRT